MGLGADGLTVPTGAELLTSMLDEYDQLTALVVDRTRTDDQGVMILATILGTQLGEAMELLQAIYDGTNSDAAIGKQLEDASFLVGVEPDPATKSQATVTLSGTVGTIIPANSIVEGDDGDDDARWFTSADLTIAGTGSPADDVVVTAQEAGPILAAIGVIDKVVSGIPGWTGVTNAAAAVPGQNRESDAAIRSRRRVALNQIGSASTSSIRAALLDLDFVDNVLILENNSASVQTVESKSMNANSIWVFVYPGSLTTAQEDQIAKTLHLKTGAATEMMAGATTKQVTDAGGVTSHTVKWDYVTADPTTTTATVVLKTGFELADVTDAVSAAIIAFIGGFAPRESLTTYDLTIALAGIEGIASVTFGASVGIPYTPAVDKILTLTSVTVA